MLRIQWMKRDELLCGFHIQGHAGEAAAGENIVCAAVSAIAQCTAMGIMDVAAVTPVQLSMEDGDMLLLLPDELSARQRESCTVLLETMRIGLESIALDNQNIIEIQTVKIA